MGQFRISLPNNQYGDVRWGRVTKKQINILELLRLKKSNIQKNIGYIVTVRPVLGDIPEYHLMKSRDGEWLQHSDSHWVKEGEGTLSQEIKKAIDAYEKNSPLI